MNNLIFRSPKISDLIQLLDYINTLSKEKTYIRKQGGLISLEGERKYLSELIKDIENKKLEVEINSLKFHAKGLKIKEKNHLKKL